VLYILTRNQLIVCFFFAIFIFDFWAAFNDYNHWGTPLSLQSIWTTWEAVCSLSASYRTYCVYLIDLFQLFFWLCWDFRNHTIFTQAATLTFYVLFLKVLYLFHAWTNTQSDLIHLYKDQALIFVEDGALSRS
jgi:hypothetical protein